jgi:hypothetical protein
LIERRVFRAAPVYGRNGRWVHRQGKLETLMRKGCEMRMFLRLAVPVMVALASLAAEGGVPSFNVEPHCRAVAAMATPVGDPQVCLRREQRARADLIQKWSDFHPADKAHCLELATIGPEPTYTHLLACLEIESEARKLRDKSGRETGAQPGRR